jgi:hypothetical protein
MARKQRGERAGRLKQIRAAYQMTKQVDRMVLPIVILVGLGTFAVCLAVGFVIGHEIYLSILGVLSGLLASTIVFGRRAERAAYSQVEGKPGAAAAVLNGIRRGWTVTPAVSASRNKDGTPNVVHRAVGRPGIVLIGEGSPSRLTSLLAAERKKMVRIAGETPVHDVIAGSAEGQVPLRKLQSYLMKLPRALRPGEVTELNNRLRAAGERSLPMPKGPLPKNARIPRGGKIR